MAVVRNFPRTVEETENAWITLKDGCRLAARMGMPVDRVIGLVDGAGPAAQEKSGDLVVERRPIDGRIVHILDPGALVARGEEVIENATL